ncbi:MAG: ribosome maturation factor RimM, partial [bacterium]
LGTHGVGGWLKVRPLTDRVERFTPGGEVFAGSAPDGQHSVYVLEEVKYNIRHILLKLSGVSSRENAEGMRGQYLCVPESEVPPVEEEDTYYHYQIIGLIAVDEGGQEWGRVVNIFPTGSNDIYVLEGEGGKEYYLPAFKRAVKRIDLAGGRIVIDSDWLT